MKKIITALLIAICAFSANAQLKKYTLEVGEFNQLTVSADIEIDLKCNADSAGQAVYVCHPKVAPAITFTNNKNKLKVEVINDEPLVSEVPRITLYTADIQKVTNLGDSTLCVYKPKAGDSFSAKVIGNGTIIVSDVHCTKLAAAVEAGHGKIVITGKTQEAKYTIASVGAIKAFDVDALKVKCWMIGSGTIDCVATESLTLYGAGSGTVVYKGSPAIKKRTVGVKLEQAK